MYQPKQYSSTSDSGQSQSTNPTEVSGKAGYSVGRQRRPSHRSGPSWMMRPQPTRDP